MARPRVLVTDDDPHLVKLIQNRLEQSGYDAICAHDSGEGLRTLCQAAPQAVILRDRRGGSAGWELATRIREISDVPILILSERDDSLSIERGLRLANEYLPPPWNWARLLAKLALVVRRRAGAGQLPPPFDDGRLRVDLVGRRVTKDGQPVHLTALEFRLLSYLVRNSGRVLTYQELLAHVWGHAYFDAKAEVSLYMGYLRRKLEDDPSSPAYIFTQRGRGYSFRSLAL